MYFVIKDKDLSLVKEYLDSLPKGEYKIEVTKYKRLRSNAQNNFYWAMLEIISGHTGESQRNLHKIFAKEFLGYTPSGSLVSTSSLSPQEFSEYMLQIELKMESLFPDFQLPITEDYGFVMTGEYSE